MTIKSIFRLLFLTVFLTTAMSIGSARACGTVDGWIESYNRGGGVNALHEIASWCGRYQAGKSGPALALVLFDANSRGIGKDLLPRILKGYRCLPDIREVETANRLKALADELGAACPASQTYLRVKTGKGNIRLRKTASTRSEVLGFVYQDMLVDLISRRGAWMKVRTWNEVAGYVRASLMKVYNKP